MGLEKAIKSGKEHRKEYFGAKKIDKSCRNHGGCPWCEENRTYKNKKIKEQDKKIKILWYEEFTIQKEK